MQSLSKCFTFLIIVNFYLVTCMFIFTENMSNVDVSLKNSLSVANVDSLISCGILCACHPCHSFFYNVKTHTCVLQGDVLRPNRSANMSQSPWSMWVTLEFNRTEVSEKVTSGNERSSPMKTTASHSTRQTSPAHPKARRPRLLVVPDVKAIESCQITLDNLTRSPYEHLNLLKVDAVTMVFSVQKLLVSVKEENTIESYDIDSDSGSTVISNYSTTYFGVDQKKDLVFFYSKKGIERRGYLVRYDIRRNHMHVIKMIQEQVSNPIVVVDHKRKLLYMNIKMYVVTVLTYNGKEKGKLFKREQIILLSIDNVGDNVYCHSSKVLYKISLNSKVKAQVKEFRKGLRKVVQFDNKLYVALSRVSKLYVLGDGTETKTVRLSYQTYTDWDMCVLK